ncbi:DUF3027 domain-containing protein [Actinomyces dentalis]|uniref:DUF3027 domain-containing protein n=1 Tax=Actinomyces dentalis TaxID=272548 RepID=UPI000423B353|nr:DUF3027 domain-containing protein [Actinomyces dentalis]
MTDTATHAAIEASTPVKPPGTAGTLADTATSGLPRPGSLPTRAEAAAAAKDRTLTSPTAVGLAHAALGQITEPLSVGEHVAARSEGERLVTHLFECNLAGYRGWRWAVTLTRPPRSRTATICELELLPGEDAVLAPTWIPWAERLRPGDITRADRLPRRETDERLEPGWEATGDEEGDVAGMDALDFGRARVLSPQGVRGAARRWYEGEHGPEADGVRKAHASCSTCGFFVPLAGPLRRIFGICANEWAADDGRVVSLDHGCGAHSETDLPDQGAEWPVLPSRLDESAMEPLGTDGVSLRGGLSRDQAEALAAGIDQELAGQSAGAGAESDAGARSAGEAAEPDTGAESDAGARSAGEAAEPDTGAEPDAGAPGAVDSPQETESIAAPPSNGALSTEDRRASALTAVADLAAGLGIVTETQEEILVPRSLEELEARLPFRD